MQPGIKKQREKPVYTKRNLSCTRLLSVPTHCPQYFCPHCVNTLKQQLVVHLRRAAPRSAIPANTHWTLAEHWLLICAPYTVRPRGHVVGAWRRLAAAAERRPAISMYRAPAASIVPCESDASKRRYITKLRIARLLPWGSESSLGHVRLCCP